MNSARRSFILMGLLAILSGPGSADACWFFGAGSDCEPRVATGCVPLCRQGPVVLMPQTFVGTVIPVEAVDPLASGGLSRNDGGVGPFLTTSAYEWNPSTFGGASGPGGSPFLFDLRRVATSYPLFAGGQGRGGGMGGSRSSSVGEVDHLANLDSPGLGSGPFSTGSLLDRSPIPLGPSLPGMGEPTAGIGQPSWPSPGDGPGSGPPSRPSTPGVVNIVPEPAGVVSTLAGLAIAVAVRRLRCDYFRLLPSPLMPRRNNLRPQVTPGRGEFATTRLFTWWHARIRTK